MSDLSQLSSQEEALKTCLKNLFVVPAKNIESAFQLVFGLIKEQSSQIDGLRRAHGEALDDNARARTSMHNAVYDLTREKDELSVDFQALKRDHHELLKSHGEAAHVVDGLKYEIEMLAFNCFGVDSAELQGDQVQIDEHVSKKLAKRPIGPENTFPQSTDDKTCNKCKGNIPLGWGTVGFVGLAEVKFSEEKLNADWTISARLDRLEQSLSTLVESLSSLRQVNGQSPRTQPSNEKLEEISIRIHEVETFLRGFDQPLEEDELQPQVATKGDGSEHSVVEGTAYDPAKQNGRKHQDDSAEEVETTSETRELRSRGSLIRHLNEREMRAGLSIDDLALQISDLREVVQKKEPSLQHDIHSGEVQHKFALLCGGMQKKLAELELSVRNKVSSEDSEAKMQDVRSIISNYNTEMVDASRNLQASTNNELVGAKRHIMELASKLEEQLEQVECDLKSLFKEELLKQQLDISRNAEKTENDLTDIRLIIDSHNDTALHLRDEMSMSSHMDAIMNEDNIITRIQQATNDVRVSLEERLDKLSLIESEVDGFASKMAEKPSKDQIESMLHDLEKRLGKDEALQIMLANMKIELKRRMTRGEVIALVRHTLKGAKLGIENTQDTLMVGRISYCLGCSKSCPTGVNGTRAPKKNHDSLPPAHGLVSNATLYGAGNRGNLHPLQMLRSAPLSCPRPKSAILGRFSASSAYVRVRNNSR